MSAISSDAMARAAKPGGLLVALDYNHALNDWHPDPPPAFAEYYRRFLSWREGNGWVVVRRPTEVCRQVVVGRRVYVD